MVMDSFPNFLILYGSQTGTGEELAERIAREAYNRNYRPLVSAFDDFTVHELLKWENKNVIFIASTTGQGDMPDNMQNFWKMLCLRSWKSTTFVKIKYSVIGLGDSSYEKYNFIGKKLFRRFSQLGGEPIFDICLGDDQHDLGYLGTINPWLENMWLHLKDLDKFEENDHATAQMSKFLIHNQVHSSASHQLLPKDLSMEIRKVIYNTRVTSEQHWQDTRLIAFDLTQSKLQFRPGYVLVVQPSNLPKNVEKFFTIFPELRDAPSIYLSVNPMFPWSKLSPQIIKMMGPQPWSWEKIVTHILDIQSIPRLHFFEVMNKFAKDELEQECLSGFCTPAGQENLIAYCNRPKRSCLEVFEDLPKTTREIPPVYLFDMIPAIKPRSFSIASSPVISPDRVEILVAVVEYQTMIKEKRKGLCSNWLAHHCPPGTEVPLWIERGTFKFPPLNMQVPVLMIGPGTGIAPFRSLVLEAKDSAWNKWLFFGCRNEIMDFYFKEEFQELEKNEIIKFHCAFSRDLNGEHLEYVQDVLMKQSKELVDIISSSQNVWIFVAGNSKQMPKDVREALSKILMDAGIDINDCIKSGTYQTETWS